MAADVSGLNLDIDMKIPTDKRNTFAVPVPDSTVRAMTGPDSQYWIPAIQQEYKQLRDKGVWEPARLPPGHKAIDLMVNLTVKPNRADSNQIDKYKAQIKCGLRL